ncbi:hypothetical protein ACLE20_04480 [Rhizobium sp. YIM 134829]|uniref:hypothetical protein n=1 Tax=Rhizobium sp. YIM 134829 TaxID=3390453 RepID=UPI003978557F
MDKSQPKVPENEILQEPAEGDRATIDRELARQDDSASKPQSDQKSAAGKAMDDAAPQTGVRPGP